MHLDFYFNQLQHLKLTYCAVTFSSMTDVQLAVEHTVQTRIEVNDTCNVHHHASKTLKSFNRWINCSGSAICFDVLKMFFSEFNLFKYVHGPVLITLERQLMKSRLLYFNDLVMQLNRCIYSVNLQCGQDCLIMCSHRASCYICCFLSAFLHCLSHPLFVDKCTLTLILSSHMQTHESVLGVLTQVFVFSFKKIIDISGLNN